MTTRCTLALALASGLAFSAIAFAADLPLRSITLYRSGVGYYEHLGEVEGDQTIRLRFDADRINDILKSMVLLDLSGGTIAGASYTPNKTLSKRLEDFRINPLNANSIMDLLTQLRGTQVHLTTNSGAVTGIVMGVQTQPTPMGGAGDITIVNEPAVTLLTSAGVSTVTQSAIRTFDILDESLAAELAKGLEVIAENRNDHQTNMDLAFTGDGVRQVMVGYTHAAPVWKTSYRLILPDGTGETPTLQGWAIVENDTDEDWRDVRLSLASGRPVSFVMDLQTPLRLNRPSVPVPVIGGVGPIIYQEGVGRTRAAGSGAPMESDRTAQLRFQQIKNPALASADFSLSSDGRQATAEVRRSPGSAGILAGVDAARFERYSKIAQAVTGDVGEQFIYTIDAPVWIERGESSMLPIISGPIQGRRMTIYSHTGADSHPMLGIELNNDTGLHLMPGPIAVYDAGAYAGDAQIMHIARGQSRLLSYAVDHDLEVSREQSNRSSLRKIHIAGGLIVKTHSSRQTTTYTLTNNDDDERLTLIEHPKNKGWKIIGDVKPNELTDTLYRFEVPVPAGATKKLAVQVERVWSQSMSINSANLDELLASMTKGQASKAVRDVITKAAAIQFRINALQRSLNALNGENQSIAKEQSRIRSNMNSLNRNSALYNRYMTKLNNQETRLEELHQQRGKTQRQLDVAQNELRVYLADLTVD